MTLSKNNGKMPKYTGILQINYLNTFRNTFRKINLRFK